MNINQNPPARTPTESYAFGFVGKFQLTGLNNLSPTIGFSALSYSLLQRRRLVNEAPSPASASPKRADKPSRRMCSSISREEGRRLCPLNWCSSGRGSRSRAPESASCARTSTARRRCSSSGRPKGDWPYIWINDISQASKHARAKQALTVQEQIVNMTSLEANRTHAGCR